MACGYQHRNRHRYISEAIFLVNNTRAIFSSLHLHYLFCIGIQASSFFSMESIYINRKILLNHIRVQYSTVQHGMAQYGIVVVVIIQFSVRLLRQLVFNCSSVIKPNASIIVCGQRLLPSGKVPFTEEQWNIIDNLIQRNQLLRYVYEGYTEHTRTVLYHDVSYNYHFTLSYLYIRSRVTSHQSVNFRRSGTAFTRLEGGNKRIKLLHYNTKYNILHRNSEQNRSEQNTVATFFTYRQRLNFERLGWFVHTRVGVVI